MDNPAKWEIDRNYLPNNVQKKSWQSDRKAFPENRISIVRLFAAVKNADP